MKKKQSLYLTTLILWLGVSIYLIYATIMNIYEVFTNNDIELYKSIIFCIITIGNTCIFSFFFLNSIKDLMFSVFYLFKKKSINKIYQNFYIDSHDHNKKVILLYCTCNDFNEEALLKSMKQDYLNYKTIILDDSNYEYYINKINDFANKYKVEVVRRIDHIGFKAGNLNNYLLNHHDYDYFIVLDSDEIIPSDYTKKALTYFEVNPKIGAIQAKHKAQKGHNLFQSLLGMCISSNNKVCQLTKGIYGCNSLFGHGMMIKRECLEAVNGFPLVVAEDISISVKIKEAGYEIMFADNIICEEEFPSNYLALKKRQCKWTQGNLEYMKNYNHEITKSNLTWFEKLDLRLSHYTLPVFPIISLLLTINVFILGYLGFMSSSYGLFFVILLLVFLISPIIPDVLTYSHSKKWYLVFPYFLFNIVVYASMAPMMIWTVVKGLCGKKAKFIITPKDDKKLSFIEIFNTTIYSFIFGLIIGLVTFFAFNSIVPTLMISLSCVLAPFICASSNIILKNNSNENLDKSNKNKLA